MKILEAYLVIISQYEDPSRRNNYIISAWLHVRSLENGTKQNPLSLGLRLAVTHHLNQDYIAS